MKRLPLKWLGQILRRIERRSRVKLHYDRFIMKTLTHRNLVGPAITRLRRKLGWSQTDFAIHLQLAGWNISRSGVARMEAQLVHVGDRELCYLRQVLRVDVKELFPALNPHKTFREGLAELLNKELRFADGEIFAGTL